MEDSESAVDMFIEELTINKGTRKLMRLEAPPHVTDSEEDIHHVMNAKLDTILLNQKDLISVLSRIKDLMTCTEI